MWLSHPVCVFFSDACKLTSLTNFTHTFLNWILIGIRRGRCCHPYEKGDLFKYMTTLIKISNHLALILPCSSVPRIFALGSLTSYFVPDVFSTFSSVRYSRTGERSFVTLRFTLSGVIAESRTNSPRLNSRPWGTGNYPELLSRTRRSRSMDPQCLCRDFVVNGWWARLPGVILRWCESCVKNGIL